MKKLSLLILSLFIIGLISTPALFGQNSGDFRSAQTGNWGDLTTWQTYNGSNWVTAATTPDSTNLVVGTNAVTIISPNNVTVAATVGVRNVTVNQGATVTVNGTPVVLNITQGYLQVNGTLTLTGTGLATNTPSVVNVSNTIPGTTTIGSTGIVNYNQTLATTAKGGLPSATWSTGSTLNVNSTGGPTASGWGSGGDQNFSNINWSVPTQGGTFGWGFGIDTLSGTLSILNTKTARFQLFGGSSGSLTINGDFNVSGSASVTTNGTSSITYDTVNVYGKVNVNTTGDFSISRGSQGSPSDTTGTAIFNFYGDSVRIIPGSMSNSFKTTSGGGTGQKFVFKGNGGTQYLYFTIPSASTGNIFPIEVDAGATVSLASTVNVSTLYLSGGIIVSSASHPLVMGWWNGTAISGGTLSPIASGSATSYVNGPMAYLYATAAGSTTKTYPIGKDGIYRPLTLSLTQTAATLSTYTAEMFNSAPLTNSLVTANFDRVSSVRYYTISEDGGGSAFTAGQVLLNYDTNDGVSDIATVRIAQGPSTGGGTWVDLGGTGTASPTGTITSSNAFTDLTNTVFTLADINGGTNSLPVELSSFTANNNGRTILLNWETKTEKNSNKFEIERSSVDNLNWVIVGVVQASGTINTPRKYSYTEKNLQSGKYQYRLKMIDNDGSFKYSNVVETEIALPKNFALSQNYPNPFNPSTKIDYQVPVDSKVILEVYNIAGQKVNELVNSDQSAGYYTVDFGATKLSSGVYIYRLAAINKATGNNFSSIKKMMLLK